MLLITLVSAGSMLLGVVAQNDKTNPFLKIRENSLESDLRGFFSCGNEHLNIVSNMARSLQDRNSVHLPNLSQIFN